MYATDRKVADANVGDLQLQGRLEQGFWDVVTGACVSCEALHGTGGACSAIVSPQEHLWCCMAQMGCIKPCYSLMQHV